MTFLQRLSLAVLAVVALGGGSLFVYGRLTDRPVAEAASMATRDEERGPAGISIDQRRQQLIGVRTAPVTQGSLSRTIRAGGTVGYDATRLTDVNLKLEGWITDSFVNYVGQPVSRGQALFTLFSPELLSVQNELLLGLRNREGLTDSQVSNAREFGERVVDVPRQTLLRWDVPAEVVRGIEESRRLQTPVEFRSPADGIVIETTMVKGMHVDPGQTLYRIADLSAVWIEVDFREVDLPALRVGTRAEVTATAWPGQRMTGRVVNVYPYLSEQTRTVKARVALANRDGRLKPGMFVSVDVAAPAEEGLLVPADAIVDSGSRQMVFVSRGEGRFEPRDVTVGARSADRALVLAGLHEHEEVAASGTFFLESESQMRTAVEQYRAPHADAAAPADSARFDVRLDTSPAPPIAGENVVEVRVRDAAAQPVTDAEIEVIFGMAAMPSMNMPAMRFESRLTHVSNGLYRGRANLMMRGSWNATVVARRGGHAVAETQTSLLVR